MAVSKRLRFEIFRRDNHTCRYCGQSAPDVTLEPDHVVPVALGGSDEPSNLVTACSDCNAGKSSIAPDAGLVADVEQDALRWSKAMERAAELHRVQDMDLVFTVDEIGDAWSRLWLGGEWIACYEPDTGWYYRDHPDRKYPWVVKFFTNDGDVQPGPLFDVLEDADARADELNADARRVPRKPKDWRKAARAWARAGITVSDFRMLVREVIEDRDYVQWDRKWSYTAGCCWGLVRQRQSTAQALLAADAEEDA